jgi:hypothetical protein
MSAQCTREDELLDAMGRGFVGPELDEHAAGCASCRELRLVAGALLEDRNESVRKAAVPTAGTMWWRMKIRQRHEAQARTRQTLLIGQAATLLIAIVVSAALLGPEIVATVRTAMASIHLTGAMLLAFAGSLVLAPLAGWVALRQK